MKASFFIVRSVMLLALLAGAFTVFAQDNKDDQQTILKNNIEQKNYSFIAQSAMPMQGRVRQLTTEYRLRISGDSVIADLPYFGRAYTASIGTTQGGIQFTSTDAVYTSKEKKKGGWEISIKPNGNQDARELFLSISANGYASLQVSSNNRQSISFNGFIKTK